MPLTPLIGRQVEVRRAKELIKQKHIRLLTLTGPGGSGKTRLGLEVAIEARDIFRDGVFFVDLASIRDPRLVQPAIARALNIKAEKLSDWLRKKQLLILVDNFEHLIRAAPDLTELLTSCPALKFLVTSREKLLLRGEHELEVFPLALPKEQNYLTVADISRSPAIQLFIQRAQALKSGFMLNEGNALAIAGICRALDGLPLAIELAAAQTRLFLPEMLLERIQQKLKMIPGPRDLPARQQTLRATFDWSYSLLQPQEKELLMKLSVFSGGATLGAVRAVAGIANEDDRDVLVRLDALVNKNLLRQAGVFDGELRFNMLETIREYALEKLEEDQEMEIIRMIHLDHFLALAKKADEQRWTPGHIHWLDILEAERGNLHEALRWASNHGQKRKFLELAGSLWLFWSMRGPLTEGRVWLEWAVKTLESIEGNEDHALAINILIGASELARIQGDTESAIKWKLRVMEICHRSGEQRWLSAVLHDLAIIYADREECERSLAFAEKAVALRRKIGIPSGIAHALGALYYALICNNNLEAARKVIEESTQIDREQQNHERLATDLVMLIYIAIRQERYMDAQLAFEDFLPIARELADHEAAVLAIHAKGTLSVAKGDLRQAAHLLGMAEQVAAISGVRIELPGRAWIESTISAAKTMMGEIAWNKAYKAGQSSVKHIDSLPQVLDVLAIYLNGTSDFKKNKPLLPAGMTAREMEIFRLVAQGLTDIQVAQTLVISSRTVNAHLTSIYNKLGVNSRTAAMRYAIEHDLF